MRTPQPPRSGFTLIELTIALSIAVVLAGVVLVRVDGWSPRQELNTSARALGNTIRTWREKAQLEESVYILQIDRDKGTWKVFEIFSEGVRQPVREGKLLSGQVFEKFMSGEEEITGPVVLRFGPRGFLFPLEIILANEAGDEVVLSVDPLVNEVGYAVANDE